MSSRTNRVVVRYTSGELAIVRARARDSHMPLAEYLRDASLSRVTRAKRADGLADLVPTLNEIGLALSAAPADGGQAALHELRAALQLASRLLRRKLPVSDASCLNALE